MKHVEGFKSTGFELPQFAEDFIRRVMYSLKMHDVETFEHCLRVSSMALEVAKKMDLNIIDQAICMYAGLLHDVGKMKIPTHIINKPSRLSPEEFEIMKKHAEFGVEVIQPLTNLPFFRKVSDAVHYHHERVDGKGYFNLPYEKIPLASKVILVVDTVDAMTQDRPYRKGVSLDAACDELMRCSGTQFENQIVDVYLDLVHKKQKIAVAA